ncbi:30S ribosomal protein S7 [candidate division WOR-1 bacterium RIFOXYA12_FULL_52_29]|uniref:Small ribosomal subunit protein uS7 n=1 Tax=candidate division WOR-1 bacterium RIFOXYC12_FULL_54_18 TaxID=1802584 RepID=A0A1F4T632_UNCSA|nr:MAG: 30S ribosomal protein S7 [candidate division WOR-1 bacterium RIFOXYA2_FULL_51_19]OGC17593.1 MAG: 30S ribosomal protein S7 [candidate division WOR-1 bacterium RIFOXYA12_FULL_52_29]OGC26450.1 MAG: 30S ribosomal protein S7 [candidate division WOR-1 bacterium RIFOXYB2_FULL_45_9]OGC28010.1 MAG: 30S ribosomal protein S7 [candidate division WOR-1 bacterium RIFOXYC12_FULL_54_18]OGC29704.1 MAG: 30S ribosomal protein S7 [candidate division WOR-1 bacterium RIFOXYB12_FULL_52_16]
MPRYGRVPKRKISPDPIYNSAMVQRFINKMIQDGKKSKVEKIFYDAMEIVESKLKKPALEIFTKAIENLTPLLEVKPRRVGGATYQIPVEVSKLRGEALAMQWLRESARERSGRSMAENLSGEMIDAHNGAGNAMKNRETLHKTAEANKAFAHFRW